MLFQIVGELTDVSTEPTNTVGATVLENHPTYGPRIWKYVKNGEASTAFAAGNVVQRKASTTAPGIVTLSGSDAARNVIAGVAQHAIAAGSYGWVGYQGIFKVLAGTETIDVNVALCASSVAGSGQEASGASDALRSFGQGLEDAASTALGLCWIFPQGG